MEDRRRMDPSPGEQNGRRNDRDSAARFGERDERLRVAGLEDDSRSYPREPACCVERIARSKFLA